MTTQDGVNHNTKIVIEQGAAVEDIQSGAQLDVQAGASETVEGTVEVESGGILELDTGAKIEINNVDVTSQIAGLVNAISDNQRFIGLENILKESTGTWTQTRIAQGDYGLVLTPGAVSPVIGIDITDAIRTSANKGFELTSIDVIHKIGVANLTSQTLTLQTVNYANNVANAITNIPVGTSGACSTAIQTNPYVDNLAVATPAYNNLAASKIVAELTIVNPGTSTYTFYGLNLHFTKSSN
jgi:hypothetical protein